MVNIIPCLILFLILQRYYEGVTAVRSMLESWQEIESESLLLGKAVTIRRRLRVMSGYSQG